MDKTEIVQKNKMNKLEQVARLALEALEGDWNAMKKARAALREALAEQAKQAEIPEWVDVDDYEEQKQKPVAYAVKAHGRVQKIVVRADVADELACKWRETDPGADFYPLYAAPLRTKDLTDDEKWAIFTSRDWTGEPLNLIDTIIAADRELNDAK